MTINSELVRYLSSMAEPIISLKSVFDDSTVFPYFTGRYGKMVEQFLSEFPTAVIRFHNQTKPPTNQLVTRELGSRQIEIAATASIQDLNENPALFNSFMGFYLDSLTKEITIGFCSLDSFQLFPIFLENVIKMMRDKRINNFKISHYSKNLNDNPFELIINELYRWNNNTHFKGTMFSYQVKDIEWVDILVEDVLSHDPPKYLPTQCPSLDKRT